MGASNAMSAFRLYAGKIPPLSMNVLTFMALVSMDKDREPKYWEGHEALAVHCMGRDEASIDDSDLRAVRRAITPLFKAGAITVAQHSSGRGEKGGRATYQLHLVTPAQDGNRPVDDEVPPCAAPDGNRPVDTGSTGRNSAEHRTESDRAPDGNRPAKEYEETEELEKPEEQSLLSSDSVPVGAREARDGPDLAIPARDAPKPPRHPAGDVQPPLMAVVPDAESPPGSRARCRYPDCPTRADPVGDDGLHDTCRYLAGIKARSPHPGQARERTEAS